MMHSIRDLREALVRVGRQLAAAVLLLATACTGQAQPSPGSQPSTGTVAQPGTTTPSQSPVPTSNSAVAASPAVVSPVAAIASPRAAVSKPAAASSSPSSVVSPGHWNFDADPVGGLPAGAQVFSGQWAVRAEPDAPSQPNALCQTGQAEYPAIGLDTGPYTDLTLTARFKPISGKEDQAGGLLFRVQDKDNYYIARGNALEDNVIFFVYVGARRSQLKGANAKVANGVWHDLRVDVRGNSFVAFLDGNQVVDVTDDRYKSGGIGLWTKSDSVTCFDDVELTNR